MNSVLDCLRSESGERAIYQSLPGEPADWHLRFTKYFLPLGAGRSLLAAYNAERAENLKKSEKISDNPKSTSIPIQWRQAARDWNWWKRASAWDYEIAERSRVALEKQLVERQLEVLNREWITANKLLDLGDAVADKFDAFFNRTVKIHPDERLADGTIVRRETVFVEVRARDAIKAIEVGNRLARQATGLTSAEAQKECMNEKLAPPEDAKTADERIEKMLDDLGIPRLPPNPAALRAPESMS